MGAAFADPAMAANQASDLIGAMHLLVVDDNPLSRDLLSRELSGLAGKVSIVNSGEAALNALREHAQTTEPIQALLLDWKMSGMDGLQTAQAIRLCGTAIEQPKIVLVSASSAEELPSQRELVGAVDAVLQKPATREKLLTTFSQLLEGTVETSSTARPGEREAVLPQGTRVLLVEDSFIYQQMVMEMLRDLGAEVALANNGVEALELLQTSPLPDIVLMDVEMPEMGGIEACRRLRERPECATLPVIAMTAHALKEDEQKCLRAGMNDFLGKPVDPGLLRRLLQYWVDARRRGNAGAATPEDTSGRQSLSHYQQVFVETNLNFTGQLEALLQTGQAELAAQRLHSLKGEARGVGADAVADVCALLEQALQSDDPKGPLLQELGAAILAFAQSVTSNSLNEGH